MRYVRYGRPGGGRQLRDGGRRGTNGTCPATRGKHIGGEKSRIGGNLEDPTKTLGTDVRSPGRRRRAAAAPSYRLFTLG